MFQHNIEISIKTARVSRLSVSCDYDRNNVNDIIKKHINHPSIKNIKKKYKNINKFSFRPVTTDEVKKVIKDLKTNKSVSGEIPIQILKESEFTFECLKNCINHSIEETRIFPSSLKLGNITPIFKKDDPLDKSNYRPVSILPLLSKVYKRIIYNPSVITTFWTVFKLYIMWLS